MIRWSKAWLAAVVAAAALGCFKSAAKKAAEGAKDPSGDMTRCLMGYGWAEARAMATEDSLWRHDAPTHRQEVATCIRQRKMQAGSCLQLYYKWSPGRALAVDDSIRRAQMRR